ncbi:hypothetical protein ACFV5N_00960 [Streptomyces sp. NPDC059853]|uniref:hypothetical protein n=1 Tax=Streptomyces sp. NPDC059853 TaxID=3346973 RepID=UPI003655D5A2
MTFFVSFMRFFVPVIAGAVISGAARIGLDLDDAEVTAAVQVAVSAAYFAAFVQLERYASRIGYARLRRAAGVLLGWVRPPDDAEPPRTDSAKRVEERPR